MPGKKTAPKKKMRKVPQMKKKPQAPPAPKPAQKSHKTGPKAAQRSHKSPTPRPSAGPKPDPQEWLWNMPVTKPKKKVRKIPTNKFNPYFRDKTREA